MDIAIPNSCLWHSLGLADSMAKDYRITRSKTKAITTVHSLEDFKENIKDEEKNCESCFTEIKKHRRNSLHIIRQKINDDSQEPTKRKRPSNKNVGKKNKKVKPDSSTQDSSPPDTSATDEPCENVSDIYRNRLWRQQMPVPVKFETIPEEGEVKRVARKEFRFIDFSDAVHPTKAKRRLRRAAKNGWKKVTKKRLKELDEILARVLERVNQEG